MLTDKEVFDNTDMIDLATDDKEMQERLEEALDLLDSQ